MRAPFIRDLTSLSLAATVVACSVHDSDDNDAIPSTSRYLVVVSGVGGDFITGTMDLDLTEGVTGTARMREGDGPASEHPVTGSIIGAAGELAWGSYTASFEIAGESLDGVFEDSQGGGVLAGVNAVPGGGQLLCGTYGGDDEGVWNFVVTDAGVVRGAFMGFFAAGSIDGNAGAGDDLALSWFADEDLSGTADGSIDAGRAMGGWSGPDVQGTWASDETVCP